MVPYAQAHSNKMPFTQGSFIEGENKIIYDEKQVRSDVQSIFRILASSQKVSLNPEDIPQVLVQLGINSQFNPQTYTVSIRPANIGDGDVYSHEASHGLRYLSRKKYDPPRAMDIRVQEFFGYVGVVLGRKLLPGSGFQHLYTNQKSLEEILKERRPEYLKKILGLRRTSIPTHHPSDLYEEIKKTLRFMIKDYIAHYRAQQYAFQLSANELLRVDGLYSMPDAEIQELFFRRRHQ